MQDPLKQRRRRRFPTLLEIDAAIDSGLFRMGEWLKRSYTGYSARLEKFSVRGFGRGAVELVSDGLTIGAGAAVVVLAFAIPAFDETRGDGWRTAQEYSVNFYDRYGALIGHRGLLHDDRVPLEEIPDHMIKATLATEDRRFFVHFGIDVIGTFRAIIENMRAGGVVQGGSSLTQQLAKNLFLTNERTIERKIKEAFLAVWLEARLTKDEILKMYLDRAYLGGGTIGVEAASRFYFGKSVRDITLAEAAMIAGLFKAPGRFAPHIDLPAARARANVVLDNIVEAGLMTAGQVYGARRAPATAIETRRDLVPDYFLDYAFEEVKKLGNGRDFVLEVKTTLDPAIQRIADTSVETILRQNARARCVGQAAMVIMEPQGAVRAVVGGRDYGASQFNRATQALRQPGSSFKAYVYMTALMNGYTPNSIVNDAPICIGRWCPGNYSGGYSGRQTLTRAFARSVNTIPVRLTKAVGRETIAENMARMGIRTPMRIIRSMELGASELTVLDHVTGYSVFANGGFKAMTHGVLEIRDAEGDVIYDYERDRPARERIFPANKIAEMNSLLHAVTTGGTGRRAQIPGVTTVGKTGTSQAYRDAWFVGFTGNYVGAVWMGNDDFTQTARLTGGNLPAMIWQSAMAEAHRGIDLLPIPGITGPADVTDEDAIAEAERRNGAGSVVGMPSETVRVLRAIEGLMATAAPTGPSASATGGTISSAMAAGEAVSEAARAE